MNTPVRIAHFLSQLGQESGFKVTEEDLANYTINGMREVFGCIKPSKNWNIKNNTCAPEFRKRLKLWNTPNLFVNKPEALGNYVYADRGGNGNEESGDGFKYRGRGVIQFTTNNNYKEVTRIHNLKNPNDQQKISRLPI